MYIDTHTHIYLKDFEEDRKEVITECVDLSVSKLFLPNIDSSTIEDLIHVCDTYPEICHPMIGLHPCSVKENFQEELNYIYPYINSVRPIAIGEIGIDLYWDKTTLKEQIKAFEKQINWAKEFSLPIVIHARDSYREIFDVLDKMNDENLCGIFHCFSSNLKDANHILSYGGFKLGIGGVVTFKNAGLDKTLANISLNNLVLETDSPYLTPAPFRGKRNKSSYIPLIAKKLSEIYNIDITEIAKITTNNAAKIFNL
jgi:TatD DNase family protein